MPSSAPLSSVCSRLFKAAAVALVLLSPSAVAQAMLDEVMPLGSSLGRGIEHSYVKIFNPSDSAMNLGGWRLTNRDASGGVLFIFPSVSLVSGHYLKLHLTSGTDDLDDSDGVIDLYAGDDDAFDPDDAAALYQGPAVPAALRDYVSWSQNGTPPQGDAVTDAETVGLWQAADYVDISAVPGGASIARIPSGWDTDTPADWGVLKVDARLVQVDAATQNPAQESPIHGSAFATNVINLTFVGPSWGEEFNLQVDDDPGFGSPEINQVLTPPGLNGLKSKLANTLGPGLWHWRVRIKPPGQPYLEQAAVWQFVIEDPEPALAGVSPAQAELLHGVARRLQHKDSELVCIWDQHAFVGAGTPHTQNGRGRPGCDPFRFAGQAWDGAHAQTNAHVTNCGHCAFYCARACTQMLNHFYGGNLFQDRISYQIRNGDIAGPEGDLGHDRGFSDGEVTAALNWALGVGGVAYSPFFGAVKPTFAQMKAWLANGPIVAGVPGHVVVLDGWRESTVWGVTFEFVHVQDPWPGNRTGWFWFPIWVQQNDAIWALPAGAKAGINNEAAVTADADGDGLKDFDEQNPRPFCSLHNDADTEDDEVRDKREVEAYTFHEERDHAGHDNDAAPPGFADVDGDGLRSECDCDSDNDSDFDGGEDIDGDGDGGMGGWPETDMFGPPHELKVFTDKKVYLVGETVRMTGWDLHENSTYPYDIIPGCPDLVDNQGIGQAGVVTTNDFGRFPWTPIFVCPFPGTWLAVVDVLKDSLYSEPDNWDPWTCWACILPCYNVPPGLPRTPSYPRQSVPGVLVEVNAAVITGYAYDGVPSVYVQDPDGPAALRVEYPTTAPIGTLVCFKGITTTNGCETTVTAEEFTEQPFSVDVEPLFVRNKDIGGAPIPGTQPMQDHNGANNTCTLITTTGRVLPPWDGPPMPPGWFRIWDGSMVGANPTPVDVDTGPWAELLFVQPGDLLQVTGISSCTQDGRRKIIIRHSDDVRPLLDGETTGD